MTTITVACRPLLVLVAALAAVHAFTHAPPPWRARRSIDQQLQLGPDPHAHLQAQQQLRHLEQISRTHLQNWAALQQLQMKPQLRQQQQEPPKQPNNAGPVQADDRTDAPAAPSTPTTPRPHHAGSLNDVDTDGPPSKCVWAILTCCQPQSSAVRYSCFELLNCPGAFWDGSPCEPEVTSAALRRANKFYEKA